MSTQYQIEEFFKDFPWLKEYHKNFYGADVGVGRISPELLEDTPTYSEDSYGDKDSEKAYLLFDGEGKLLDKVPPKEEVDMMTTKLGLTIGERIAELGVAAQVKHIAKVSSDRFILNTDEKDCSWKQTIILYKAPKTLSLEEWIENKYKKARKTLDSAKAAIDKETK